MACHPSEDVDVDAIQVAEATVNVSSSAPQEADAVAPPAAGPQHGGLTSAELQDADTGSLPAEGPPSCGPQTRHDDDGGSHAAVSPLSGKRLNQIPGLVYPTPSFLDMYHPAILLYAVIRIYAETSSALMPAGTFEDAEPPLMKFGNASAERRYVFGLMFVFSLPVTYIVAAPGVAAYKVTMIQIAVATLSLGLSIWFLGEVSIVYTLLTLLFPLYGCKYLQQSCLAFCLAWIQGVLGYAYYLVLLNFPKIIAAMPNEFLAGALPTVCSSMVTILLTWAASKGLEALGRPGLPPIMMTMLMSFSIMLGDLLRLVAMLSSEGSVTKLISAFMGSLIGDFFTRARACPLLLSKLSGKRFVIFPSTDCFLRLRFTATYLAPSCFLPCSVFAFLGGASWPRQMGHWAGYLVYFISAVLSDFAVIGAHRWLYPEKGESFMATLARLSVKHRSNLPAYQPDDPVQDGRDLWSPSCLASRWKCVTDNHLAHIFLMQITGSFVIGSVRGFFSTCGVIHHVDLCSAAEA